MRQFKNLIVYYSLVLILIYGTLLCLIFAVSLPLLGFSDVAMFVALPVSFLLSMVTTWVVTSALRENLVGPLLIGGSFGLMFVVGAILSGFSLANALAAGSIWFVFLSFLYGIGFYYVNQINVWLERIELVDRVRWSRRSARPAAAALGLLVGVATVLVIHWVFSPGDLPIGQILVGVIIGGLIITIAGYLLSGLQVNKVDQRLRPNQGIWRSLSNAFRVTLLLLTLQILFTGIAIPLVTSVGIAIAMTLLSLVEISLLVWIATGGGAATQHLVLRRVLYHQGVIPWNYARFLDYATQLIFLRKVGVDICSCIAIF
jgi:hypothetical protein